MIDMLESRNLLIIIDITQTVIIYFHQKIGHYQWLDNRIQLRISSMFHEKHSLTSLLCENFDQFIIFSEITIIENQTFTCDGFQHTPPYIP